MQISYFKRKSRSNYSKIVSKYVLQMVRLRDTESSPVSKKWFAGEKVYLKVYYKTPSTLGSKAAGTVTAQICHWSGKEFSLIV